MDISREDQKSVYYSKPCRTVFRRFENACLRKWKPIHAVVRSHNLQVWPFSRVRLVEILQHLLERGIFGSDDIARSAFPELFKTPVPPVEQVGAAQKTTNIMSVILKEQQKLLKVIEGLLDSGSYSDLTIITHGKQHQVHQAIVCPQSEFIAKACRFRSQTEDYGSATSSSFATLDFREEDSELVGGMIQFFYRSDYDSEAVGENGDGLEPETSEPFKSPLILHAKMYALAEKYIVEGLKALSLTKLETGCCEHRFATEDFFSTAKFVYTSTIETDRGMRDAIVKTFYQNPEHLDSDAGQATLQSVHGLSYDILQYVRGQRRTGLRTTDWPWP